MPKSVGKEFQEITNNYINFENLLQARDWLQKKKTFQMLKYLLKDQEVCKWKK